MNSRHSAVVLLKQQHQLFASLMVVSDAAVVAGASFCALRIRALAEGLPIAFGEDPLRQSLIVFTVPIALIVMRSFGLYRPRRDRTVASEVMQIAKASVLSMLALLAVLYATESDLLARGRSLPTVFGLHMDGGRIQLGAMAMLIPFMVSAERLAFRLALRWLRRRGWNLRHVAVVGTGRLGQICATTLERNSWTGLKVAFFINHLQHSHRERCMDRPVLGGLADLEAILEKSHPDAVYLALPSNFASEIPHVLNRLSRFPVDVRVVPDINPRHLPQSMVVNELDGMPVLSYRECPTHGMGGLSKRAIDLLGAFAALVIFAPVMLAIAILVRLSGPGPIIFKQRRVSLGGQTFDLYKFRTMRNAEDEPQADLVPEARAAVSEMPEWTPRGDPRITPVGRLLRRTSLDELPQLFNVLCGDMSLVGPRPERPELIVRFREDWRGYMLRQHVKAGMTGWAQVNGLRGQTSLRKRLQYDLFYIRYWSIGFDLRILILTLFRGFVHRNAH